MELLTTYAILCKVDEDISFHILHMKIFYSMYRYILIPSIPQNIATAIWYKKEYWHLARLYSIENTTFTEELFATTVARSCPKKYALSTDSLNLHILAE